jgi:hypothetical protein
MKNKKYEGSVDTQGKMPSISNHLDDRRAVSPDTNTNRTIELDNRIIEVRNK